MSDEEKVAKAIYEAECGEGEWAKLKKSILANNPPDEDHAYYEASFRMAAAAIKAMELSK